MIERVFLIGAVAAGILLLGSGLSSSDAQPSGGSRPEGAAGPAVTGRVTYSTGRPAALVPVVLRSVDPAGRTHQMLTGQDGRFEFQAVAEGAHRLFEIRVYVDGERGRCEVLDRRDVPVGRKPVRLGDLKMTPKIIMPVGK